MIPTAAQHIRSSSVNIHHHEDPLATVRSNEMSRNASTHKSVTLFTNAVGGRRLILDVRHVNENVPCRRMTWSTPRIVEAHEESNNPTLQMCRGLYSYSLHEGSNSPTLQTCRGLFSYSLPPSCHAAPLLRSISPLPAPRGSRRKRTRHRPLPTRTAEEEVAHGKDRTSRRQVKFASHQYNAHCGLVEGMSAWCDRSSRD